jgi:hypothetical protein
MPQRQYSRKQTDVTRKNMRITLPIPLTDYNELKDDAGAFREWLDEMIENYPELFPADIEKGYTLHDVLPASRKLPQVQLRRIRLKEVSASGQAQVYTIASSDVLPYMVGLTDEVEKALFLRRFGVPLWALSYVFGRDDAYWYRLCTSFGRNEVVSTTLKSPADLPAHLLADEKHVRFNGTKGYIATTVGQDCVLGAALALQADTAALTKAYGVFKTEATTLKADYAPQTVNTDGWQATQNAWRSLFPAIVIIECFLHAFLKIRDRCKRRFRDVFAEIRKYVWDIYHAIDPDAFRQQVADFQAWAGQNLTGSALAAVEKLCAKTENFILAFDYPDAHRTSNMVDRHMEPLARWLFSARFFHGHWHSAELQVRSWALFHNFWPYCPRAAVSQHFISPAHKLNGTVYHANWLHNLLISTSAVGSTLNHRKR